MAEIALPRSLYPCNSLSRYS